MSTEIFISLTNDTLFKTLWLNGSHETKSYLNRIFSYLLNINIKDYYLEINELPEEQISSIHNRVDILLVSKDNKTKINIELNPQYNKYLRNRNESYLYRLAGDFYAGKRDIKYQDPIDVRQINLNNFISRDNKDIGIIEYIMSNHKYKLVLNSIKIIDIYLPVVINPCYNIDEEIKLDFKMFKAQSFKEMEEIAKGNKERMAVMRDIKDIIAENNRLIREYEEREYQKAVEEYNLEEAKKKGLKEGKELGIKKGESNLISKLLSSGMSKEEISRRLDIPINQINT